MQLLLIFFVTLAAVSGLGITFLYVSKNPKTKNTLFYLLMALSMFITFLNVTSLPSNYVMQKIIALGLGLISLIALIVKLKASQKTSVSNLLVAASVLSGLIYLFFFIA